MKKLINIFVIALLGASFASCEKADPFVARVVSPVLLLVQGSDGVLSSGMTTEPSVPALVASDASVNLRVLELDKTGILDYKVGIDSLPVSGVKITFKLRSGAVIKEVSTDAKGVAVLSTSWASLGVAAPKAGSSVRLTASGIYKEVPFSKYFIITGK
ncbi:hypothetical protein [Lacihabitans soyangensis]|uniref:Big-1 domain-containing protein n=1 Tax=Lacihabitans soyangensis TaxID=869394 RepID=A0AAE3KUB4_9BACT|nr:hypothetical protein [Lacihabitans soyangensis]MCP9764888.1 hypothetical protein [Lacihabitans soyangensis]